MRTNIEIDDRLMADAMAASGQSTKRAAVEAALQLLVRLRGQAQLHKLWGTIDWTGDLDEMRRD